LDVIYLAAEQGTALMLEAEGEDAEAALDAMEKLFIENFGQND
jgi:phosphotransferase system HPr-like phosphotransfer protein